MAGTTIEGRSEHVAAAEGALVRIDEVIAGYFPWCEHSQRLRPVRALR